MTVHIEFMSASDTHVEVLAPGTDWVGSEDQGPDRYVLALSVSEVAAIEGTLPELAARITALVTREARQARRTTAPGEAAT